MITRRIQSCLAVLFLLPALIAVEDWREDTEAALLEHEGRPFVIFFTSSWCGWCAKLKADSAESAVVAEALKGLPIIEVSAEDYDTVFESLGLAGLPSLVLVNDRGEVVGSHTGYRAPEQLAELLRAFAAQRQQPGHRRLDLWPGEDLVALAETEGIAGLIGELGQGGALRRQRLHELLIADRAAAARLWPALADEQLSVRIDAARALVALHGPTSYDPFADRDTRARQAAAWRHRHGGGEAMKEPDGMETTLP